MVKEEIVGTYWYVINNGRRWITQGNKPTPYEGYFQRSGPGMALSRYSRSRTGICR